MLVALDVEASIMIRMRSCKRSYRSEVVNPSHGEIGTEQQATENPQNVENGHNSVPPWLRHSRLSALRVTSVTYVTLHLSLEFTTDRQRGECLSPNVLF